MGWQRSAIHVHKLGTSPRFEDTLQVAAGAGLVIQAVSVQLHSTKMLEASGGPNLRRLENPKAEIRVH